MKNSYLIAIMLLIAILPCKSQNAIISSPDTSLKVILSVKQGVPVYSVTYQETVILEDSPLGVLTNAGDFSKDMTYINHAERVINEMYVQDRIKKSKVRYHANELIYTLKNKSNIKKRD